MVLKFTECGRFEARKVCDVLLYFFCFKQLGLYMFFKALNVTQRFNVLLRGSFAPKFNDKNQVQNTGGCSSPMLKVLTHRPRFPIIEIKCCTFNFNGESFRINQALAWWSSFFKTFLASFVFTFLAVRGLAVEAFKSEFLASVSASDAHAPILLLLQR